MRKRIFVNLKRFDIPRSLQGICPVEDPVAWIRSLMTRTLELGLGNEPDLQLIYLLPEALLPAALDVLAAAPKEQRASVRAGCQSVFKADTEEGGNFGAFTSFRTGKAMRNLGCSWSMVGHSEERKFCLDLLRAYDPALESDEFAAGRARNAVNRLMGAEARQALAAGLEVLACIGETAAEKGTGSAAEQHARTRSVLTGQVEALLEAVADLEPQGRLVLGYEPVWAIGPGKTPPDADAVAATVQTIKKIASAKAGWTPDVVYGGGLKLENAGPLGRIGALDGGLVGLTRFTPPIGFDVAQLRDIIQAYGRNA